MPKKVRIFAFLTIFGFFAVSVWAGVIATQNEAAKPSPPSSSNQVAILITTIAGFASLLATSMFQIYRENRNRKWDLQDRAAARAEMRSTAEAQRMETMQTDVELARVSYINRDHLLGAIKENNDIVAQGASKAEAAYSAANDFNRKLEVLHKELQSMARQPEQANKK